MRTKCAQGGLHTSDRILLDAVKEVKVVHTGNQTGEATLDLTDVYKLHLQISIKTLRITKQNYKQKLTFAVVNKIVVDCSSAN